MKKMILLCMVLLVSSFLFSYEYIMNTATPGIGSHQGTTKITTLSGGDWDDGYYDLALPSANRFYYFGKLVTHLRICTNGYVIMGYGSASGDGVRFLNNSIPSPALYEPNNMVCPYWDDIWLNGSPGGSGDMYYEFTTLSNGNNWVSVEWRQVELRGAGDSGLVSFSVAFCNSTNCYRPNAIIFVYADVDAANASYSYGIGASVGLENSTGTIGEQFSHNQALLYNGLKIVWTPFVPIYGSTTDPVGGYEDNLPDAMLFRPSNGYWYHFHSYLDTTNWFQFGTKGDVALPGDYDGDGDTDHCVFRPSYNTWFGNSPTFTKEWGYAGDIPVPADYDGDGSLDIAVWRPSSGHWFVYYRGTGSSTVYQWGTAGDIPVPADYDNDNIADYAVWRPSNGVWFIRKSSDGTSWVIPYGTDGDIPMPGNFSSSFYSTMTIFRPSNGYWFYYNQSTGGSGLLQYGQDGDVPVPGDENAGGLTDAAVYRPAAAAYWFVRNASELPTVFQYGTLGDKPRYRRSFLVVSPPANNGGSEGHN